MTKSRKKLMSLVVAVMYAMCILVSAPVTAYAATTGHATAAYTTAQKNKATKTALAALAQLPANAAAAAKYTTSASLQKLVTAADKALATAKKMKLNTAKFKNYGRLAIAKKALAALVAAEKAAADTAAAATDKTAAEAVVAKIALIPATVTAADEATVNAAKTAFDALTANGKKLVTNAATLTAAVARLADLKATFSVTSVKATSAKTFKVVFSRAVADTTKVKFEVKKLTTPITVTATWNEAKTEAVLTGASVFAEATYSVNVKNDTTDLGTTTIAVTPQKVTKITVTSTKLAVISTGLEGYASYKVYDQYENDITTGYLAQNIKWTSSGTVTSKDGMLTVTVVAPTNLLTFQTVTISGYETTNGVSASASLAVSAGTGTLSDFKLGSVEGIKLVADDATSVFYIPYTAKDLAGNETTSYKLIEKGMYFVPGTDHELATNSYVRVRLVQDPADSKKAAVELKVITPSTNPVTDLPVIFTAMTLSGVSTQVTTTLYRGAEVANITLMAPSNVIGAGATDVVVPFEAFDQAGKKITKYSDIVGKVTFSSNLTVNKKVDGSLELKIVPSTLVKDTTVFLTAVVSNTGKMSSLSLTVQDTAKADSLALDTSAYISAMEVGSSQHIDFGDDMGGLALKDQYDNNMDMLDGTTNQKYKVVASVATGSVITISTNGKNGTERAVNDRILTGGVEQLNFTAGATEGSSTVTLALFEDANNNYAQDSNEPTLDTRSLTLSVIKDADIKDFTVSGPTTPIYASALASDTVATVTAKATGWYGKFKVYGKTSGGTKVLIKSGKVTGMFLSNNDEFLVTRCNGDYDGNRVTAKALKDASKTSATTTVTLNILHDGDTYAVTSDLTSSTVLPKAVDAYMSFDNGMASYAGMTVSGNEITLDSANYTHDLDLTTTDGLDNPTPFTHTGYEWAGFKTGCSIVDYNAVGAGTTMAAFYIKAKDTYGKTAPMGFSQIKLVKAEHVSYSNPSAVPPIVDPKASQTYTTGTTLSPTNPVSISNDGTLDVGTGLNAPVKGDSFTFTGTTNNGLVVTFKVIIK